MSIGVNRRQVKYLEDVGLAILTKAESKPKQRPPPKVRGKHFSNLDYLAEASLVRLTTNPYKPFPSKMYKEEVDCSYYEQCFIPVEKLGEGSFGTVMKVIGKEDNRFYGMKISKEPFRNDFDRKWKLNEVNLHSLVSAHPNIVTLYDAWEEDRHIYMQMELCKSTLGKDEVVSEAMCWDVLVDMVSALDYIHGLQMGHFDVKLENILHGYDGLFKLTDFGLVYHFKKDEQKNPKEGDAKYMAPELLTSKREFSTKADIFSLGISILELAGNLNLPINGEVWKAMREDTFPLAQTQHLSDELFYLLTKMMASQSSCRPSAKEILDLPVVKTILEQRKIARSQLALKSITMQNLEPYIAVWAVFSALVHLVMRTIVTMASCPDRIVNQHKEDAMDVEDSSTPSDVSISAFLLGRHLPSGPIDHAVSMFATSTPFRVPVDAESVTNYEKAGLLNGNFASGVEDESCYFTEERNKPNTSKTSNVQSTNRVNPADISSSSGYLSTCSSRSQPNPPDHNICFSPSMMSIGYSPIRMSHKMKEVVKAKKRRRVMIPRNLSKTFEEYDNN